LRQNLLVFIHAIVWRFAENRIFSTSRRHLQNTGPTKFQVWFLALLSLTMALLLFWLFARNVIVVFEAIEATDWPTTTGVIDESSIEKNQGGRNTSYIPVVSYSYKIAGTEYIGHRISFADLGKYGDNSLSFLGGTWHRQKFRTGNQTR